MSLPLCSKPDHFAIILASFLTFQKMNIGKILDFKPDTELRGENPFERTEIERQKKAYGEPESKKSKFAVPAYMGKFS